MSASLFDTALDSAAWWERLGLRIAAPDRARAAAEVLRAHPPVAFAGDHGAALSADDLLALATEASAVAEAESRAAAARREAAARATGTARIDAELSSPEADAPVAECRWAGFARGEARAWFVALALYEPQLTTSITRQLRAESLRRFEAGELPEAFGYPERARALAGSGLDPREYCRLREALLSAPAELR